MQIRDEAAFTIPSRFVLVAVSANITGNALATLTFLGYSMALISR
jgi:hypothetical protein